MGDDIDRLPNDPNSQVNSEDLEIITNIFLNKKTKKIAHEFKDSIIGGILFVILANPNIDKIINKAGCTSSIILWTIKFILFIILFYILKNRF
jgi:hypothetical protein